MTVTFRSLESDAKRAASPRGDTPLEQWYDSIRDVPIASLSDFDLARACRQHLYVDAIAPTVVARLQQNPLAGMLYEGELLRAARDALLEQPARVMKWGKALRAVIGAAVASLDAGNPERG